VKSRAAAVFGAALVMAIGAACRSGGSSARASPPKSQAAAAPAAGANLAEGRALAATLFGRDTLVPDSRLLRYARWLDARWRERPAPMGCISR
jgi:hypothetical protein